MFSPSGFVLPGQSLLPVREVTKGLYVVENAYQVDTGYFSPGPIYPSIKEEIVASKKKLSFEDFKKAMLAVFESVDYDLMKSYTPELSEEDPAEIEDDFREMAEIFEKKTGIEISK